MTRPVSFFCQPSQFLTQNFLHPTAKNLRTSDREEHATFKAWHLVRLSGICGPLSRTAQLDSPLMRQIDPDQQNDDTLGQICRLFNAHWALEIVGITVDCRVGPANNSGLPLQTHLKSTLKQMLVSSAVTCSLK